MPYGISKSQKTHGQFSRLMCLNIRNTVTEIKTSKNTPS